MAGGVAWRPGAPELLPQRARRRTGDRAGDDDAARAGRHRVALDPRRASGEDPFDVTVCGDEVPARKPDPAPYLQAMGALGVEPGSAS